MWPKVFLILRKSRTRSLRLKGPLLQYIDQKNCQEMPIRIRNRLLLSSFPLIRVFKAKRIRKDKRFTQVKNQNCRNPKVNKTKESSITTIANLKISTTWTSTFQSILWIFIKKRQISLQTIIEIRLRFTWTKPKEKAS